MTNRHVKKYSRSLVIRDMQIKTTTRYHLTHARITTINKSTNKCQKVCGEKGNPSELLVRIQTGAATGENNTDFCQKLKMKLPLTQCSHFWEYDLTIPKHQSERIYAPPHS